MSSPKSKNSENAKKSDELKQLPLNFEQESQLVIKALGILQQRKREGVGKNHYGDFRKIAIKEFYQLVFPNLYEHFEATSWDHCATKAEDLTKLIKNFCEKGYIKDIMRVYMPKRRKLQANKNEHVKTRSNLTVQKRQQLAEEHLKMINSRKKRLKPVPVAEINEEPIDLTVPKNAKEAEQKTNNEQELAKKDAGIQWEDNPVGKILIFTPKKSKIIAIQQKKLQNDESAPKAPRNSDLWQPWLNPIPKKKNPASLKRKLPLLEFIGNETCPPQDCLFENPEKPGQFEDFGPVACGEKPVGLQESETAFLKDDNEETVEVKIEKCESLGKIVFQNDHPEHCSVHTLDGENEVEIKEEYIEE
ncbi:Oidioi.mRNA.OKI2018_I69.chr1.g816.t1.cds [Oikopleura dioica]|uniref:Oidioi.mRNA.OKI2018_I69.chr1.g816.t1.cds n=1 Tax=Oikopleura dioica TaxID=34765 RepID=A0ABN7SL10_OIKDI|nr:Oidioi.mRNA.OKI2018_I69.chr1.g816.t1.cds [Oikopleura dioica]